MSITVPGTITGVEATIIVTGNVGCVPNSLLTAGNGVLWEVLSGGVNYTLGDATKTPDQDDFVGNVGDQFYTEPANGLRLIHRGADSCVKMQAVQR